MLIAMTIIETGKETYKKGDEIPKKAFKPAELKKLIEDGVIADIEEVKPQTDSEGGKEESKDDENTGDDSKNDPPSADGEAGDTDEK